RNGVSRTAFPNRVWEREDQHPTRFTLLTGDSRAPKGRAVALPFGARLNFVFWRLFLTPAESPRKHRPQSPQAMPVPVLHYGWPPALTAFQGDSLRIGQRLLTPAPLVFGDRVPPHAPRA